MDALPVDGALMDASDGPSDASLQIAQQSEVSFKIDSQLISKPKELSLEQALYGEDFELVGVFTDCPKGFYQIGECEKSSDLL